MENIIVALITGGVTLAGSPGAQQLLPQGIITRPQRNMLMKHLHLLLLVLVLLFGRLNPQGKKLVIFGIK